jgi:hypothetical protein
MRIIPRPVSPVSALADLRDMFSPDRPHRWTILALSIVVTAFILWGFAIDSRPPPKEREIFYVESWMADRRDSDIIRRQLDDLGKYEAALQKKQQEFQKLADSVGIDWRADEARNRVRRQETVALVEKQLRKKLAEALEREAREGRSPSVDPAFLPGGASAAAR